MPIANSPPLSRSINDRQRQRQRADDDRAEKQRRVDADPEIGEPHGEIGAEAEERLLPDRHQSAIADQRVPHHREDHVDEQRRQPVDGLALSHSGPSASSDRRDERRRRARCATRASSARRRRRAPRSSPASSPNAAQRAGRNRRNRAARTARRGKSTWPAMKKPCGLIDAPMLWATPSTIPPTSVPHSEPAPPITAASKAKMSCGRRRRIEGRAHRQEGAGDRRPSPSRSPRRAR